MEIPQFKQCPCNCGWGEVYSNRFGISNFPCVHTIKYCNIEFNNLSLPKSKNQINEIMEIKSIDDWMFSETSIIKFNFSPPLKIPEFEYIINKDEKYGALTPDGIF